MDEDLVADTVCDANKDCQAPNARFREKCEAYRDCGNSSEPVFQCDSTFRRCLSVRQTRNCKYYILSHYTTYRNLENIMGNCLLSPQAKINPENYNE